MDGIFTDDELKAASATEVTETPAVEQPKTEPEQSQEQPRDEQGRFAPKTEETVVDTTEPEGEARAENKVPQGALHAERERRKTAEAELKKMQEQLQAFAKLREQVQSRQPAEAPKVETDDAGVKHLTDRLAQLEQSQNNVSKTLDLQRIEAAENEQIASVVAQSEAAYRETTPDYDDAIRYVVQARAQELSLYGLSPVEIRTALGNEVAEIAKSAIAQGKDPAELGYAIAKSRGYRPGAGTGEQPANTGQAQIDAIAKAKEQSRSLGQAAGSSPKQPNADAILNMSPEEFEALYTTPEGRKMIDAIAAGGQ